MYLILLGVNYRHRKTKTYLGKPRNLGEVILKKQREMPLLTYEKNKHKQSNERSWINNLGPVQRQRYELRCRLPAEGYIYAYGLLGKRAIKNKDTPPQTKNMSHELPPM